MEGASRPTAEMVVIGLPYEILVNESANKLERDRHSV
jgi:hypothetical protein